MEHEPQTREEIHEESKYLVAQLTILLGLVCEKAEEIAELYESSGFAHSPLRSAKGMWEGSKITRRKLNNLFKMVKPRK